MGYDDCSMAGYIQPRLSTVRRDEYRAGQHAFRMLRKLIDGRECKALKVIEGVNVFAESCGCKQKTRKRTHELLTALTEEKIYNDHNLEALKAMVVEFSKVKSFSEFSMQLQETVEQMELEFFYLCICGNREDYYQEIDIITQGKELGREESRYTPKISVPFAYEDGAWSSYGEFHVEDLLPPDCKRKNGNCCYIVMPIHYGEFCIGYCVVSNYLDKLEQRYIQHLVLNINNALGNIREHDIMQTMLAKINKKWMYDELTGIYNRAGLRQMEEDYLMNVRRRNRKVVVYFIDLDGLKQINDQLGHQEGDNYIKSMADILLECNNQNDVIARYGGDEYIILSSYVRENDITAYIKNIEKAIQEFNESGARHKMSASIGYQKEDDYDSIDIKCMIEQADKEMYISKKEKKARLAQQVAEQAGQKS